MHRIVYTSLVISYKFLIDSPIKNSALEKIGALKSGILVELELALMSIVNWELKYNRYREAANFLSKALTEQETIYKIIDSDREEIIYDDNECTENFSEISFFFT